jgi:hypothetical protein
MRRLLVAGFAAVFVALGAGACGTDAFGIEACRQIEEARCRNAPNCGGDFNLGLPPHQDSDVGSCIRYYRDACLHGLTTPPDPGAVAVKACVDAINEGDCAVIKKPETHPKCSFLIPPPPPATPDAAADVAPDAATADAAVPPG